MKKRGIRLGVLAALLAVLMLGACGAPADQEAGAQTQGEVGSAGREVGESEPGNAGSAGNGSSENGGTEEFFWETRALEPPAFEEMSVHEQQIVEGVSVKIATPSIGNDFDYIEQAIRANSFITDRYSLNRGISDNVSEAQSYQEGDFHNYILNRFISGKFLNSEEDFYDDFYFRTMTDYALYDNTHAFSIDFYAIPWEDGLQENIYGLLADTLGQEYAEYLVYAETEGTKNHGLEEYIKLPDGVCYELKRKLKENTRVDGAWDITFVFRVDYPGFRNEFTCYDGGMKPLLEDAKYDLEFFTEGNVSGWDLAHFSSDMPEYMAIEVGNPFIRNSVDLVTYTESLTDDGETNYSLFTIEYRQGLADVPGFECPSVDMEYNVSERDGEMVSLKFHFQGKNIGQQFNNLNAAQMGDKVLPIMREQISLMCPWLDLEEIGYDQLTGGDRLWVEIPVTCLGMECECTVTVETSESMGEWGVRVRSVD